MVVAVAVAIAVAELVVDSLAVFVAGRHHYHGEGGGDARHVFLQFAGPAAQGVSDPVLQSCFQCKESKKQSNAIAGGCMIPFLERKSAAPGGSLAVFTRRDLPAPSPPPGATLPPHKKKRTENNIDF